MTKEKRTRSLYKAIESYLTAGDSQLQVLRLIGEHYDFTPKVKELEWVGTDIIKSNIGFGEYSIDCRQFSKESPWYAYYNKQIIDIFTTLEAAKAACQEHYRTTVLSLLA